jgi:hypothetical protein
VHKHWSERGFVTEEAKAAMEEKTKAARENFLAGVDWTLKTILRSTIPMSASEARTLRKCAEQLVEDAIRRRLENFAH